jgi:hypothetical protein
MTLLYQIILSVGSGMVVIWLGLCAWMFRELQRNCPAIFESLGRPHVLHNNTLSTVSAFLQFLQKKRYEDIGYQPVTKMAGFMRAYLRVTLVVLAVLLGVFLVISFKG